MSASPRLPRSWSDRLQDPVWYAHELIPLVVLLVLLWIAWQAKDALVPFAVGLVAAYAALGLTLTHCSTPDTLIERNV